MIPLFYKKWRGKYIDALLTFSASFLLGITCLHLIPDSVSRMGHYAGILLLAGFFSQQIVQRLSHGLEHGHSHSIDGISPTKAIAWSIFIGLAVHAFSEGLPLGIIYPDKSTLPSLVLAIGLHKIPEIILVVSLFLTVGYSRLKSFLWLLLFSLLTPLAALAALYLGLRFHVVAEFLPWCIPFVAGVFIQISTTIFYENSSKSHQFKKGNWLIILAGLGISMLSLI